MILPLVIVAAVVLAHRADWPGQAEMIVAAIAIALAASVEVKRAWREGYAAGAVAAPAATERLPRRPTKRRQARDLLAAVCDVRAAPSASGRALSRTRSRARARPRPTTRRECVERRARHRHHLAGRRGHGRVGSGAGTA